jgi:folate-binding protein YgfZ
MPPIPPEAQRAYALATEKAVCFDLSDRAWVELVGKDRAAFLNNFCTGDVVKIPPGAGCEAFLTTNQAKVLAWLQILIAEERVLVGAEPGLGPKIISYLDRYLISEDVQMVDRTATTGQILVCGPEAPAILSRFCAAGRLPHSEWRHGADTFANTASLILRRDWLELPGYFVISERAATGPIQAALEKEGVERGNRLAYEMLRLEAGIPAYGIDIDETNLPQEVNRTAQAISFTKGCYVGQETVARIHAYGRVNRLRVGLKLAPEVGARLAPVFVANALAAQPLGKLMKDGAEVGRLTSMAWSPLQNAPQAMGYIRREHQALGTVLIAAIDDTTAEAEVTAWPRLARTC